MPAPLEVEEPVAEEQQPVTDVTITALCQHAGVTRRTFYNHAESPVELLKQVLTAELDQVVGEFRHRPLDAAGPFTFVAARRAHAEGP